MLSIPNELISTITVMSMEIEDIIAMRGVCHRLCDVVTNSYRQIHQTVVNRYHSLFGPDSITPFDKYMENAKDTSQNEQLFADVKQKHDFMYWLSHHIHTSSTNTAVRIKSLLIHNVDVSQCSVQNINISHQMIDLPLGALNYLSTTQLECIVSRHIQLCRYHALRTMTYLASTTGDYIINYMLDYHIHVLDDIFSSMVLACKKMVINRLKLRCEKLRLSLLINCKNNEVFKYMLSWYPQHSDIQYRNTHETAFITSYYNTAMAT